MTERLYYTDAYLTTFHASVVDVAGGGARVYLDRTAFYPTSGGQPFDHGTLNGVAIRDVIDEDDRVAHVLAAPLPNAREVDGMVDWGRRFDHMQQHTGQHLLSALCDDVLHAGTLSVHFGAVSSTVDVAASALSPDAVRTLERRANEIIAENRPVTVSFEDAQTVTGLRKPSDRTGELRVVSIDGVDRSACGGTHVRATGEIGALLLRTVEKTKGATRIEFVCGARAVQRARADFDAISAIGRSLSASIDDAPALLDVQAQALRDAESRTKKIDAELAAFRARALYDSTAPDAGGLRRVVQRIASGSVDEQRALAIQFATLANAVFIVASDAPPSVLVAASADSGVNAGRVLKDALTSAGGRGGGSAQLAQGSAPSIENLNTVIATITQ